MNITTSSADVRRCMEQTFERCWRLSVRHKHECSARGVRLFDVCLDALAKDSKDGRTYRIADVLKAVSR